MPKITQNCMEELKTRSSLLAYAEAHLQRINRKSFACPSCGSGTGAHKTSALAFGKTNFTCFSCGATGDAIELARITEGLDFQAAAQSVADAAGLRLEFESAAGRGRTSFPTGEASEAAKAVQAVVPDHSEGRKRARRYIEQSREDLDNPEAVAYLASRGVSLETARKFGLGYDKATRGIVVPYLGTDWYYMRRYIEPRGANKAYKPPTGEVGNMPLFNADALDGEAVFVVEGEFDALAVLELGFPAVGINGTSGVERYVKALEARASKPVTVVMMDNDQRGKEAADKLAERLGLASLPYLRTSLYSEAPAAKDPDEAAHGAPEAVRAVLSREYGEAAALGHERREEAFKAVLAGFHVKDPSEVAADIQALRNIQPKTPTGFKRLDAALGGGLPVGLTIIGAVSSMGKTSFAVQLADQVALSGTPVLFVTCEQSARELTAKSLTRIMKERATMAENPATAFDMAEHAPSASDVTDPVKRASWSDEQQLELLNACSVYSARYAPNLHILEPVEPPTVAGIRAAVAEIRAHAGHAPMVVIDYLQLLAPYDERASDKQIADRNMTDLRKLARDEGVAVFAISSLNRANYNGAVKLESFKESGGIEYGTDVLMGLQPFGTSRASKKKDVVAAIMQTKNKRIREVELTIIKNRNGRLNTWGIPYEYDAVCNKFVEGVAKRAAKESPEPEEASEE